MIAPAERGDGGLGWLFQLVAVFVFFVLPVIRSIAEGRKRSRQAGGSARPARPAGRREGGELWRELLEGRRPQPTKAPAAAPPRPRARPSPPLPDPRSAPTSPVPHAAEAPAPAAARPVGELAPQPPALATLSGATRLPRSVPSLASSGLDPATLDDEMAERWGASLGASVAPVARTPAADRLLRDMDWRRAVLLAEVLAPPLALRGPGAAWPGPPASLTS